MTTATPANERTARRNFILHVINGALFALGDALTSTPLVMTAFFSQLTTSNLLIGLLSPLRDAGWFLPQFFLAPMVERTRRKINAYRAGTTFRMIAWIALVVCMFTIEDRATLLVASLFCLGVFSILAGFAGLPFIIITAKIIPPNRRGLVFGLRQFIGGGLGIMAGGVVALLLGGNMGFQFPRNYAVLFAFAAVGYALSYTSLGFVHEEPDEVPARSTRIMTNLRQAWQIALNNAQYRRYLMMRIALLVGTACIPFMTVYAKRVLHVNDSFIGSLVSVTLASSLLSNPLWARLSDRRSNRLVMIITTSMGLLYCAAAAFVTSAASNAPAGIAQGLLVMMFVISGAMLAGMNLVSMPLMIEIAEPAQQSLYFGLSNTLLGVVLLLTAGVGLIVDRLGFLALYMFCGLAFAVALERLRHLRDPRR